MYAFALSNKTDDYLLRSHYGSYLVQNGFIGEAIEELQWVCDTYPEFEGGHQELGIALLLSERFSEAETSFQRVLEINPHYSKARAALKLIREQQP
jgi:Flp pilus assembly protein TadD